MLPDVALLETFDFYVNQSSMDRWYTLAHVCRKWRKIVFGSPRRLNLRLYCSARTPVRETLDIWPPLPIVIEVYSADTWDEGNVIAALKHNDRIYKLVIFDIPSSETEKTLTALQQPFPGLTYLLLAFRNETAPLLPASFLGGSAPSLKSLTLDRIPFLALPKLLLTATHLVNLHLRGIPHSGYITPEAMVTALSALTRLEKLEIGFESPRSRPDQKVRRLPPRTRTLLPVLTMLRFIGVSEYLEHLLARIDAPILDKLEIVFFYQLIFDCPQLTQFISRTPKFKANGEARVRFSYLVVTVTIPQKFGGEIELAISCRQSDWQLSSLAQVCSSSFAQVLIPTVEHLHIQCFSWPPDWQDDVENSQWLELFHPFTAVKALYISSEFTPRIAPALNGLVGERVTEVLPALQSLFLEEPLQSEPVQDIMWQFVAARQLAGHPIAVCRWERGRGRIVI